MFPQLLEGAPVGAVLVVGAVCLVLALAKVVKNLPKDTIGKFFEHRTTKYQIIASDSKGRVAAMQKQRLVFFGFVFMCIVVVAVVFLGSTKDEAKAPLDIPGPTVTKAPRAAP
ncbi:hypothetical protein ACFV42_15400 [Streptomyces solisilvae]|uniref:hypothetical protein n=1 Tax=Streptomyces malaysiensis TaxID=92644 RepID=UPI003688292D